MIIEPNDLLTNVTVFPIGAVYTGTMATMTDADTYQITVPTNDRLVIQGTEPGARWLQFNPNIQIRDASGTLLATVNDESSTSPQMLSENRLHTFTTAGIYYVAWWGGDLGRDLQPHIWRLGGAVYHPDGDADADDYQHPDADLHPHADGDEHP